MLMKYTVITTNRINKEIQTIEVNTIEEAKRAKRRANQLFVNCKTKIINNETNEIVEVKHNYYGNTRTYRNNYIKMY